MADLFIIGQFEGVSSTTAVSIGSQVMHMLTVMIVGLAMGSTVSIGQAVGGNNTKKAARSIGNTVTLFMVLSLVLMAALLLCVNPIVSGYIHPVGGGFRYRAVSHHLLYRDPLYTAYNIISSIFRGMGDSKSPMYFIAVACVSNILLDYLFMGRFPHGPRRSGPGHYPVPGSQRHHLPDVILRRKSGISVKKQTFGLTGR